MTDEQIAAFIKRLEANAIQPKEFADLTVDDIRNINRFLRNRSELLKQKYIDAIFTSRMVIWSPNAEQKPTYSEDEILDELDKGK